MALSPFGVLPSTSPRADSNGPALWPPPTGHDGRTPVIWRKPCQSPWASLKKICPIVNGFADHYPYSMGIIGKIPYFQTNPYSI